MPGTGQGSGRKARPLFAFIICDSPLYPRRGLHPIPVSPWGKAREVLGLVVELII